jgi:hypothetical protein
MLTECELVVADVIFAWPAIGVNVWFVVVQVSLPNASTACVITCTLLSACDP